MGNTVAGAIWHKSSYSGSNGGGCVEVAGHPPGLVAVRDSKDPDGPALTFALADWQAFITSVKTSEPVLEISRPAVTPATSRCSGQVEASRFTAQRPWARVSLAWGAGPRGRATMRGGR